MLCCSALGSGIHGLEFAFDSFTQHPKILIALHLAACLVARIYDCPAVLNV